MNQDRRRILGLLAVPWVLNSASSAWAPLAAAPRAAVRPRAALLLPLSGASASVGISMQRAAMLAQSAGAKPEDLLILDTGGTPAGAVAAVALARRGDARIIIGPVFSEESRAAAQAAGPIPVLSLSNDEALVGSGAFVLGITATQSVTAILSYARSRGVRRVAVLGGPSRWAAQGSAAAERLRGSDGLDVRMLPPATGTADLIAALRRAGDGDLPDALLVTEGGDTLRSAARTVAATGLQLLGTQQALELPAREVTGAWLSGPDPAALSALDDRYRTSGAGNPGLLAVLAHDAMTIVETLRGGGVVDRSALLTAQPFPAISGAIRFAADGSAMRELPILVAGPDGYARTDGIGAL